MAKTNITLYSSTPSSNTDINNINIDENCPASGLNNAIRELMAHLKNVDTGSQALTALSVTGNATVNDGITVTDSGASPIIANRTTSDGTIIDFRKDGSTVGSIGTLSSRLHIENGDTGLRIAGDLDQIFPCGSGGSDRDNAIDLGSTGVRFKNLYLSGGVYLGGTGSANKLDDYEEGTCSLSVVTGTATFSGATYTKIGRLVKVSFYLSNLSDRSSGSALSVTGLPFTSTSVNQAVGAVLHKYLNGGGDSVTGYLGVNSTTMSFYQMTANQNYQQVLHNHATSSSVEIYTTIIYETT